MSTTTNTNTNTTIDPFEAQRLEDIANAKRTLDYALGHGWRQTCKRSGKVFLVNDNGVKGWVDLRRGMVNANLYFVSLAACA